MRHTFQLAAAALLVAGTASYAQMHLHSNKPQVEDLSWMWQYTRPLPKGDEAALRADTHFKPFLAKHLTAPQTFWSRGKSLADTAFEFLERPQTVVADGNRYITATGCVQAFCPSRGLLWVDLGATHPLVIFATTNWIAENKTTDQIGATYTLWIFSSRALDPIHLPPPMTHSVASWAVEPIADGTVEQIATVILVDPDGQPHQIQPAAIGIDQTKQIEQKAHS